MFTDRNQFNLFVKGMDHAMARQVFQETVADACLHGGNNLRNLLDSYSVFLRSGDFNMNMRDFEGKLAEFLIPSFVSNTAVYEATRLASTDMETPVDAIEGFSMLQHVRESLGPETLFEIIQDGIKQAQRWLN